MSFYENHKREINLLFEILKVHVNEKHGVNVENIDVLKIKSRKKPLVYFRKLMMVILGETYNNNYNQETISDVVGLDRTSFIYHYGIHINDYGRYQDYKEEYDKIRNEFLEKIENK